MIKLKFNKKVYLVSLMLLGVVAFSFGSVRASDSPPEVDLTIQNDSQLTSQQKIHTIETNISSSKSIFMRVQNMLEQSRGEKDTIKITCLDDKVTQIHVNLRGIEERKAAFELAIKSGDESSANQQFIILNIYNSRIQSLNSEADNCIGDSDVVLGESLVTVSIDEDITVENPSKDNQDLYQEVGTLQLPVASGYY